VEVGGKTLGAKNGERTRPGQNGRWNFKTKGSCQLPGGLLEGTGLGGVAVIEKGKKNLLGLERSLGGSIQRPKKKEDVQEKIMEERLVSGGGGGGGGT